MKNLRSQNPAFAPIALMMGYFLLTPHSFNYAGTAKTSAHFLLENLSARSVAMGGLIAGYPQGTEAVFTNPAGIGLGERPEVSFSYASTQNNSSHGFGGYAHPTGRNKSVRIGFGTAISYYTAGNIDINSTDGTTKSFNAERSYAAAFSFGVKYKRIALGISPKLIRSTLVEQFTGTAYAVDAGVSIFPFTGWLHNKLIFSAVIQNLGSKIKYRNVEHDLPRTSSAGLGVLILDHPEYGSILMSAQGEQTLGEKIRYRMGGEYGLAAEGHKRVFFLRGGYRMHFDNQDYSIGVGLRERNLRLDYAFINGINLEKIHLLTLSFEFGRNSSLEFVNSSP